MNARLMMLLAALVSSAVFAVGCGSSSSDSSSSATSGGQGGEASITTSSLDRAAFVKQASLACAQKRNGLIEKVTAYLEKQDSKNVPDGVSIANMARAVLVPTIESEIAAIRKLGAPEGDEEKIETILAAQQKAIDEVEELKAAKSIDVIEGYFGDATKQFEAYGFTACTNGS